MTQSGHEGAARPSNGSNDYFDQTATVVAMVVAVL
jgi:hypothetical protein